MKSSKIKWIVGVITVVIVIAAVIGLDQKEPNGVIKIGVIAPITGQYGSIGESFKNAVSMAAENNNRIQVIFEDDKFDAKLGLSAFQKLTTIDHVDIIINESSPTLEAITPLVTKSNIPVIQIFESKEHAKDSIFQMLPFSYPLFSDLAKLAESRYKRIALVYSGANDVLAIDADYFKKGISSQGVLVNETKIVNSSDFRSEVTKILATNPDAVTNIFALSDGIKFIKEINAQKGNRRVDIICDANMEFAMNDYIKALGTSTLEGCISTNLPNLTTEAFRTEYRKRYGNEPMIGADWGYDAITIVKDLIDVPKNKWVGEIQSKSFDGVSGRISFDENGTREAVSERHIFKDGKFVKMEN